jgi:hypothetical protein
MAQFKARKVKKGFFEILGLEEFIEAKVAEVRRAFAGAKGKLAKKQASSAVPVKTKSAQKSDGAQPIDLLAEALARHPRRAGLVRAGKKKDQLLRSLVPLYLARSLGLEVNSGLTSRFWKLQGVKYAPPNAAKALRNHPGYAKQTKAGRVISPNGVKYVEAALGEKS